MSAESQPDAAGTLIARLAELGLSVATAESLTGGLVCGALTSVPGASAVVRGGVIAYATAVKADVLGVDAAVLAREGAVHPEVALAMAAGVRSVLGADLGLATTGVAGPDPSDGQPVGTVDVAVVGPAASGWSAGSAGSAGIRVHRRLALTGDRAGIREATVHAVLALALDALRG